MKCFRKVSGVTTWQRLTFISTARSIGSEISEFPPEGGVVLLNSDGNGFIFYNCSVHSLYVTIAIVTLRR